uniref:Uncharacterized protein n=1 Tax=Monodon monoceros TaxID=40151 RepID=A0A8C6BWL8_MONMO
MGNCIPIVRKVLNQMSLCLMSYSCLFVLSVMVLIIYNPLFAFIDFLQSISQHSHFPQATVQGLAPREILMTP